MSVDALHPDELMTVKRSEAENLQELAYFMGCIFFFKEFTVSKYEAQKLEALLRKTGYFYETREQLLADAPEEKE